jgi:hypothetical protein
MEFRVGSQKEVIISMYKEVFVFVRQLVENHLFASSEIRIPRVLGMAVFMVTSQHAPENCPRFSEKHRKSTMEYIEKIETLAKKHRIKILGSWTDFPEHIVYMVFDGSFDDVQKLLKEPLSMQWLSFNTITTKSLLTNEEVYEMLKKAK